MDADALELAQVAVQEARLRGADLADARLERTTTEAVGWAADAPTPVERFEQRGLAVRALVSGAWGFSAVSSLNEHDVRVAARHAVELARGAAVLQASPTRFVDRAPGQGVFRTRIRRDPLAIPFEQREALVARAARAGGPGFGGSIRSRRRSEVFVCSEGSEIEQERVITEVAARVTARRGERSATRAQTWLQGRGWGWVEELDLVARVGELAEGAERALEATPCPLAEVPVLLDPAAVASLLVHGLVPGFELDRVAGTGSGPTWLSLGDLNELRIGSPCLGLVNDPTDAGGAGSYGYDAEGTPAAPVELVRDGVVVGFLSGRESAARVGLPTSSGALRAANPWMPPVVRPANLIIRPGEASLDALVGSLHTGLLVEGPVELTLDHTGRSLLARAAGGWWIENGRRAHPVAAPILRGATATVLAELDAVGEAAPESVGVSTPAGLGLAVGVRSAPVLLRRLEVGGTAPQLPPPQLDGGLPTLPIGPPPGRQGFGPGARRDG